MKKIPTAQLVDLLIKNKGRCIEASMSNGYFKATHMLAFGGRKIYDTGIDSEEVKWRSQEFIEFYSEAHWLIEQIV